MTFLKKCVGPEAAARRCSVKEVFLEISQNSQENTCARVSFIIRLKFRRTSILIEHLRWLLLLVVRKLLANYFFNFILSRVVIDYCLFKRAFRNTLKFHEI